MYRNFTFVSDDSPLKSKGSGISVLLYNILLSQKDHHQINVLTFCRDSKASTEEIISDNRGIKLHICDRKFQKTYRLVRLGILKKIVEFISFLLYVPAFKKTIDRKDNIYVTVVGASVRPVCKAWFLQKMDRTSKHCLYIVDDLELINQKQANKIELFLIRLFLKSTIQNCDLLINISEGLKDLYLKNYAKDSLVLPPHFVKRDPLPQKIDQDKNQYTFLYTGGLNLLYNDSLKYFADVIDELNAAVDRDIHYHLRIQTYSSLADFQQLNFNSASVSYSTTDNRDDLLKIYQQCDCFLVPYSFAAEDYGMVITSFPQKVAEIIQYGRKILIFGPQYSSVNKFFSAQGIGFICNEQSKDMLKETIRKSMMSDLEVDSYVHAYEKFLSAAAVGKVFKEIIKSIN